jgi:hypothetical protein
MPKKFFVAFEEEESFDTLDAAIERAKESTASGHATILNVVELKAVVVAKRVVTVKRK